MVLKQKDENGLGPHLRLRPYDAWELLAAELDVGVAGAIFQGQCQHLPKANNHINYITFTYRI